MINKNTSSNLSVDFYNFDKFRIDLEEINRIAKIWFVFSVKEATSKSFILTFIMSEKKLKQSGKILNEAKLSYDNHIF